VHPGCLQARLLLPVRVLARVVGRFALQSKSSSVPTPRAANCASSVSTCTLPDCWPPSTLMVGPPVRQCEWVASTPKRTVRRAGPACSLSVSLHRPRGDLQHPVLLLTSRGVTSSSGRIPAPDTRANRDDLGPTKFHASLPGCTRSHRLASHTATTLWPTAPQACLALVRPNCLVRVRELPVSLTPPRPTHWSTPSFVASAPAALR